MKKKIICVAVVMVMFGSKVAMADSLTEIMDRAVKHSNVDTLIKQGKKMADLQYKTALDAKETAEKTLSDQPKFQYYYDMVERGDIMMAEDWEYYWNHVMKYGPKPLTFYNNDYYEYIIYPKDVAWYEIQKKSEIIEAEIPFLEQQIKLGVIKLYNAYFELEEAEVLQGKTLDMQKEDLKQSELKYKKGLISKLELEKMGLQIKGSETSLANLKIQKQNVKIEIANLIGESDIDNLKIDNSDVEAVSENYQDVFYYINLAQANRYDVKKQRLELEIKEFELNKAKEVFIGEHMIKYGEIKNARDEAAYKLDVLLKNTEKTTYEYFIELTNAKRVYLQEGIRFKEAKETYNKMKLNRELENITANQFYGAEISYLQASQAYGKALRDYRYAFIQLKLYAVEG